MFNRWVELALFHDTALFSQAVSKLEAAGIPYKVKDQSIGPKDRRTGSLGGSSRFNNLFQIYVKKEDLDRARHALREPPPYRQAAAGPAAAFLLPSRMKK